MTGSRELCHQELHLRFYSSPGSVTDRVLGPPLLSAEDNIFIMNRVENESIYITLTITISSLSLVCNHYTSIYLSVSLLKFLKSSCRCICWFCQCFQRCTHLLRISRNSCRWIYLQLSVFQLFKNLKYYWNRSKRFSGGCRSSSRDSFIVNFSFFGRCKVFVSFAYSQTYCKHIANILLTNVLQTNPQM